MTAAVKRSSETGTNRRFACATEAVLRRRSGNTVDIRCWNSDNDLMAIKAVAVDDQNTQHLIIGLNRRNINSLLDGDVFTLPSGVAISITEESGIVLVFAETDEDLEKRFPPRLRPV